MRWVNLIYISLIGLLGSEYIFEIKNSMNCNWSYNYTCNIDATTIEFGQTIIGDNYNTGNNFNSDSYDCYSGGDSFDGNDLVYVISIPDSENRVFFRLIPDDQDLDIFILRCIDNELVCIDRGTNSGLREEIRGISNVGGKTFYIVIDGYNQSQISSFTLTVSPDSNSSLCENDRCEDMSVVYAGTQSEELRYGFQIPSSYNLGQWSVTGGDLGDDNILLEENSRTIFYAFPAPDIYKICYLYIDNDGCEANCCRYIQIDNPYNSNCLDYEVDDSGNRYRLSLPNNISALWSDDDVNAILGTTSSIEIPVPVSGICTVRNFSSLFYDSTISAYRMCCISIYICNSYDCDYISTTYQTNTGGYRLSLPDVIGEASWRNDDTDEIISTSNSVSIVFTEENDMGRFSVLFFDSDLGAYRICSTILSRPSNTCPNTTGTLSLSNQATQSNDTDLPEIYLCAGDEMNFTLNGYNFGGDPNPNTEPGVYFFMYQCAPTVDGTDYNTIISDPCHIGDNGTTVFEPEINTLKLINEGQVQAFLNTSEAARVWFAPVTVDNYFGGSLPWEETNGEYGACLDLSLEQAFQVVYLNPIIHENLNTNACEGSFRIRGGLPQEDGSIYSIEGTLDNDPSISANITGNLTNNSTLNFSVPQAGQYTFSVSDGKTCTYSFAVNMGACVSTPTCRMRDSLILVELYNATDGENWASNNNWLSEQPLSEWFGVTTNEDGCVIQLKLCEDCTNDGNNLNGILPSNLGKLSELKSLRINKNNQENGGNLSGNIPPGLGDLLNLESLSLSQNELNGSIPKELGRLSKLQLLSLSYNQLSGRIPPELGNLPKLWQLYLDNNTLTGNIPIELSYLFDLQRFFLGGNELNGRIPPELGNLSNLRHIQLSGNNLTDSIPLELGDLSHLIGLSLSNNQLSGNIPSELGNLSSLSSLHLNSNQLVGSIPPELGNLSNLSFLYLQDNQLSGCFPQELLNQCSLEFNSNPNDTTGFDGYNLINNSQLPWQGDFQRFCNGEDQIGAACDDGNENTELDQIQEDCTCAGTPIVVNECRMRDSLALVAFYNDMDGGNWTGAFRWLTIEPIDSWQGVYTNEEGCVIGLQLINKSLRGPISKELGELENLKSLLLYENQLSGEIPKEIGNLQYLTTLWLYDNQLSGEIPKEIGNLEYLDFLDISYNELSGSIPAELGRLQNLTRLYLRGNQLSGSIPVELGQLQNLITFYLYDNQLSGEIPVELGNLQNLEKLELYINNLSGEIPKELGDLQKLRTLDLFGNQLSGEIPKEIGNLQNLSSLGLSNNQLNGYIPSSLGDLQNLSYFYLDGNQLEECFDNALNIFCSLPANSDSYESIVKDYGIIYEYSNEGYNFTNNPKLPWKGDFQRFCNGEEQIDAPCDDGDENTENDQIQTNCSCVGTVIEDCESVTTTADTSLCTGETLFWDNRSITAAGEYIAIFPLVGGCDSTVNLLLTFVETKEEVREVQSCDIDEVGTDTLLVTQSVAGCDSLLLLEVSFSPTGSSVISRTICEGEEVLVNGERYDKAGVFEDIIPNSEGCDSLVVIAISALQPRIQTQEAAFCTGESYYFADQYLTREGLYKDTLRSLSGCDSIITFLDLNEVNITNFQAVKDEEIMINTSREINIYPLGNDVLAANESYTLELLDVAMYGNAGINGEELNYQLSNLSFIGDEVLRYVVCAEACPSSCDTASIYIKIYPDCLDGIEERLPSGIIQDAPNANACFDPLAELRPFCTVPISEPELIVIDINNQIVSAARPYEAWCGKDANANNLPSGTYYYIFRFRLEDEEVILRHWVVLLNEG